MPYNYYYPDDKYQFPNIAFDDESIDFLIKKKKSHQKDRELFFEYMKEFGREDREFGSFFKKAAAEEMKQYRGACYALSCLACNPPGDCLDLQINPELASYADNAFYAVDLEHYARNFPKNPPE